MSFMSVVNEYKKLVDAGKAVSENKEVEPIVDPPITDQGFKMFHIIDFASNIAAVKKDSLSFQDLPDAVLESAETVHNNYAYFNA